MVLHRALVGSLAGGRPAPRLCVRARLSARWNVRAALRRRDRTHRAPVRRAGLAGRRSGPAAAREAVHGAAGRAARRIASYTVQGLQNWVRVTTTRTFIDCDRAEGDVARDPDRRRARRRCCPSRAAIRSCSCSSASTWRTSRRRSRRRSARCDARIASLLEQHLVERPDDRPARARCITCTARRRRGAWSRRATRCSRRTRTALARRLGLSRRAARERARAARQPAGSQHRAAAGMSSSASSSTRIMAPGLPEATDVHRACWRDRSPTRSCRRLQAHGDGCAACARTLAELARSISPAGGLLGERYQLLERLGTADGRRLHGVRRQAAAQGRGQAPARDGGGRASAEKRRARFLREAQLLASLSHPNVLTVHDVGGVDRRAVRRDGAGRRLADVALDHRGVRARRGGRSSTSTNRRGAGSSAAHQLGVVHRDVKPENILVARDGRVLDRRLRLAGLVGRARRHAVTGAAPRPRRRRRGAVLGTPAYMAPEQHDGRPADMLLGPVSFCVSLYESLHGRRPFAGDSAAEIAAAMRTGRPAAGGDGVPRAVDRVVARGLAVDPRSGTVDGRAAGRAGGARASRRWSGRRSIAGAMGSFWRRRPRPRSSRARRQPNGVRAQAIALLLPRSCRRCRPSRTPANRRRTEPSGAMPSPPSTRRPARPGPSGGRRRSCARSGVLHPEIDSRLLPDSPDGSYADRKERTAWRRSTECRSMPGR